MSIRRSSCAAVAVLGLAVALGSAPASAQSAEKNEDVGREGEAGLGVAAGLASIVYAPAKVLYAAGGGLVAGLAYVFSAGDKDITEPILTPALRGDYVVTPAHLRGEKQLDFIGREPSATSGEPAHAAAAKSGDGLDSAPTVASDATESQ
jgi:hypothetical protein